MIIVSLEVEEVKIHLRFFILYSEMEVLRVLQVPVFNFAVLFVLDLQRLDGCGPIAGKQLHHVDWFLGFF
jgi:hypothetical protein